MQNAGNHQRLRVSGDQQHHCNHASILHGEIITGPNFCWSAHAREMRMDAVPSKKIQKTCHAALGRYMNMAKPHLIFPVQQSTNRKPESMKNSIKYLITGALMIASTSALKADPREAED